MFFTTDNSASYILDIYRGTLTHNFICKYSATRYRSTSSILVSKFSDDQPYFTCLTVPVKHNHHKTIYLAYLSIVMCVMKRLRV